MARTTQPLSSVNNSTNIENEKNKKSLTGAPPDDIFIEEEEENEADVVEEDDDLPIEEDDEPMDLENSDPSSQQKTTVSNDLPVVSLEKTKNNKITRKLFFIFCITKIIIIFIIKFNFFNIKIN